MGRRQQRELSGYDGESPEVPTGPSVFLLGRTPRRYLADPRATPAWRRVRKLVLARDHSSCRVCCQPATDVDHIVELMDGGAPYDPANLQALCGGCHAAKSSEARYQRASRAAGSWGRMALCPWCSGGGLCGICSPPSHPCSGCLGVRLVPEQNALDGEIPSQSVLAEVSSLAWAGARPPDE